MAQTKEDLSFSKKHIENARMAHVASRTIMFYHKANAGMGSMNLTALNMPSELSGQTQITPEEISGARLFLFKKNLLLTSSIKGELIEGIHYAIADSQTIVLLATGYPTGATAGEIFIGRIFASPLSDLIVSSAKNIVKTYELAVGQNILNLGVEYPVNAHVSQNIGSIKVFRNGVLLQRNTNNSSTVLDKDYYEIHAGNGYGTTLAVNNAPAGVSDKFVVDFGICAISDANALGTIESLNSAIIKIATDLANVSGTALEDYLLANPSETERRAFGDLVLSLNRRLSVLEVAGNAGVSDRLDVIENNIEELSEEVEDIIEVLVQMPQGGGEVVNTMSGNETDKAPSVNAVKAYSAPKASPAFTGTPTAPTPVSSDNSTKLATTAFVTTKYNGFLVSPAFTGTPTAPTPASSDNSTKLATTAFVKSVSGGGNFGEYVVVAGADYPYIYLTPTGVHYKTPMSTISGASTFNLSQYAGFPPYEAGKRRIIYLYFNTNTGVTTDVTITGVSNTRAFVSNTFTFTGEAVVEVLLDEIGSRKILRVIKSI